MTTTETQPTPDKVAARRKRRIIRIVLSLAAGGVLGELCPLLPVQAQMLCHLAAKIVSLVAGGS